MKALLITLLVLGLAGIGGYYLWVNYAPVPDTTPSTPPTQVQVNSTTPLPEPPATSPETGVDPNKKAESDPAPEQQVSTSTATSTTTTTTSTTTTVSGAIVAVSYQNNAFSPASIEIKVGDTVTFTNNSSASIRIASNPHPGHTSYPALDSGTLAAGATYSIVFPQAVTVNYHNHLNPAIGGTIVVK